MGSQTFVKTQYGKETTRGTAVAATKRFWGTASIPKDRVPQHPKYTLGVRAESGHTEIRQILADPVTLAIDDGYYQALPMMWGILLKGGITPTEQTVSKADYLWDFTPDLTAPGLPDTVTLQTGDNDGAYIIEYLMGKKLSFDFSTGDDSDWKISEECFGRQVTPGAFTAAINTPLVMEPIVANTTQIWIDSTWATLGTTTKTNFLRSGSIEVGNGNHPKFMANNSKLFSTYGEGYAYGVAKFVFEGGAEAITQFNNYQAGTPKAVRVKTTGQLIAAGGLAYSQIIDMYGTFDEAIPLSGFKDTNTLYGATFSTLTDLQATQHNLGVKVSVNQNAY